MKNKKVREIYEIKGVFGAENDSTDSTSNIIRIKYMLAYINNLNNPPKRVLDLGCGTGFFSEKIKTIFPEAEVIGVDISQNAVKIAKKKYPKVKFMIADAEVELPFQNEYFDLIISGEHIEHLKDVDTYLMEINRVMGKKGVLILTTPNLAYWLSRIFLLLGRQPFYLEPSLIKTLPIISFAGKTFPEDLSTLPSGHLRLYTFDMLKKLLGLYGFKTIEAKGANVLKSFPLKQIDQFLSKFPSLSFVLVLKIKKNNKLLKYE